MRNSPRLGFVIVYVENVLATVDFYEKAFGLKRRFVHDSEQYAEMETGKTALAFAGEAFVKQSHVFSPNRATGRPAGAEVALVVDDVVKCFSHAVVSGAKPVLEPEKKPWGQTVSYVRDNNGFIVEICDEVHG